MFTKETICFLVKSFYVRSYFIYLELVLPYAGSIIDLCLYFHLYSFQFLFLSKSILLQLVLLFWSLTKINLVLSFYQCWPSRWFFLFFSISCPPPVAASDYYQFDDLLNAEERAIRAKVRECMEKEVAPIMAEVVTIFPSNFDSTSVPFNVSLCIPVIILSYLCIIFRCLALN